MITCRPTASEKLCDLTAVLSVRSWVTVILTSVWCVVKASSLHTLLCRLNTSWEENCHKSLAWLTLKGESEVPLLFEMAECIFICCSDTLKKDQSCTPHAGQMRAKFLIYLLFWVISTAQRNIWNYFFFFTLPGTRIREWQRTACKDMRYRRGAGHIQCALSCKTAGAQPVPAARPGLKGTSTCENVHTES